jgi:hypothetical protein
LGQDILTEDYDPAAVVANEREKLKKYCEIVEKYRLYM